MITLYDYQQRAVDDIRAQFAAGKRSVLFVLPTGGGKTATASYMVSGASAKRNGTLMLAHREELIDQISGAFTEFAIPHGRIQRGHSLNGHPAQVAMIGTVARRLDKIAPPDMIVVDEAHHATASTYRRILDAFPRARVIGLTATPARTDGRGLGEIFDGIVIGPAMRDLIAWQRLSPYRLFAPDSAVSGAGLPKRGGDYVASASAERMDKPTITGDAIAHYARAGRGQPFIAFCASVEHAGHVAEQFTEAGWPCRSLDGSMAKSDRAQVVADFRAGRLLGLSSCDLISEGFDVPGASVAILLRPTASLIIYLQQVGRVLRYEPGKTAVILDHVNNYRMHGLPDQPREWTLDGATAASRTLQRDAFAIRRCKNCFSVYEAALPHCPNCHALAATQSRKLDYRDGELVEITELMERAERLQSGSLTDRLAECRTVADLLALQQARGYKKGWALGRAIDHLGMPFEQAAYALGYSQIAVSKMKEKRG